VPFDRVKSSRTLLNLLQLLAFQVGSEVSLNELASCLSVDAKMVQRYLDLLEKRWLSTYRSLQCLPNRRDPIILEA